MPILTKTNGRPLLRSVAGKPHATAKDHLEEFEDEDVNRDPESSNSDGESSHSADMQPSFKRNARFGGGRNTQVERQGSGLKNSNKNGRDEERSKKEKGFKIPVCGDRSARGLQYPSSRRVPRDTASEQITAVERAQSPGYVWQYGDPPKAGKTLTMPLEDDSRFDVVAPKRAGRAQHAGKTYNRSKTGPKFTFPTADRTKNPKANKAEFKQPPTPGSSNESQKRTSRDVEEAHPYEGAQDFVDEELQTPRSMADIKISRGTKGGSKSYKSSCRLEPPPKRLRVESASQESSQSTAPGSSAPQLFKMPETMTQADARFEDASDSSQIEEMIEEEPTHVPNEGPCPMLCGKTLPRQTLELLDPRATLREQQEFCRRHQIKDAKKLSEEKGYPKKIEWKDYSKRLQKHKEEIKKMIERPEALFFRKDLEARTKKQKNRTVFQQWQNDDLAITGAGYYGPRGLELIIEYVTNEFSAEIMEGATKDKLIAAQSASGYIEAVLAPEVATLLIKDDMLVSTEEARRILSDTQYIGNLLHPTQDEKKSSRRGRIVIEDDGS